MAQRLELVSQLRFDGSSPPTSCTVDATTFVTLLESRSNVQAWTDQQTASHALACMEGKAGAWIHERLRTELMGQQHGRYEAVVGSWILLKPIFATTWGVKLATASSSIGDMRPQRPDEGFADFASRVIISLGKHRDLAELPTAANVAAEQLFVNYPAPTQAVRRGINLTPEQWTAMQNLPQVERYTDWHDMILHRHVNMALNLLITRLSLMFVKAGMRGGNEVHRMVWLLPATTPIGDMMTLISTEETKLMLNRQFRQKVVHGGRNGHNGHNGNRVSAVSDEEETATVGPPPADVAAAQSRKKAPPSNQKKNKVVCKYCNLKNHTAKECFKRIRDEAAGVHLQSNHAKPRPAVSAVQENTAPPPAAQSNSVNAVRDHEMEYFTQAFDAL